MTSPGRYINMLCSEEAYYTPRWGIRSWWRACEKLSLRPSDQLTGLMARIPTLAQKLGLNSHSDSTTAIDMVGVSPMIPGLAVLRDPSWAEAVNAPSWV